MRSSQQVQECEWHEICESSYVHGLEKTGLYQEKIAIKDDPFEGEELQDLQELLSRIEVPCTPDEYISTEGYLEVCSGYIDSSDPNWREVIWEELLGDNLNDLSPSLDTVNSVSDDEYDRDLQEPEIK